jgi:hypothetical protein
MLLGQARNGGNGWTVKSLLALFILPAAGFWKYNDVGAPGPFTVNQTGYLFQGESGPEADADRTHWPASLCRTLVGSSGFRCGVPAHSYARSQSTQTDCRAFYELASLHFEFAPLHVGTGTHRGDRAA